MFKSYKKSDWVNLGVGAVGICFIVVFLNVKLYGSDGNKTEQVAEQKKVSYGASVKVEKEVEQEDLDKRELYENESKQKKRTRDQDESFEDENHVGFTDAKEVEGKNGIDQELIDNILNENTNASGFIEQGKAPAKEAEPEKQVTYTQPVQTRPAPKPQPVVQKVVVEEVEPERKRKTGFNTMRKSSDPVAVPTAKQVMAVVHGDQILTDGSSIKMRLKEDLVVGGRTVRRNTIVYGSIKFGRERALVDISSMRVADQIVSTDIKVYGLDGMEGILINDFAGSSETREGVLDEAISDIGQQIGSRTGTRALFRGARDQNRIEKITVVGNTKLILK